VGAVDPLDALLGQHGIKRPGGPAVGVGDEDPDVIAEPGPRVGDALGNGRGDPIRLHVEAGIDTQDSDARDVAGQGEQLPGKGATADDRDPDGSGMGSGGCGAIRREREHGARR